ncbi:MAG: S9 family peptidase, partial [Proteobacteria bacterium]|nr:S9 family peptidase [Pseudomonadota bacterium]
ETSKEGCLAIDDEAGCLAFATNARGDTDEIVVRSLETFELLHRVPVAGEVGFFVLDLKCMEWSSPDELFVVVAKHARCSLLLLDLKDHSWSAPLTESTVAFLTRTKHGMHWVASDFSHPGFIQAYRDARLETVIHPSFEDKTFVAESLWYPSYDGRRVQGWLLKNTQNPQAPLIVMCHGGPTWAIIDEWGDSISQVLVRAGYHVFHPNFRGSTTFGTTFMNMNIGDVGGGDLQDVVYGARTVSTLLGLEAKPIIMGASYGGYLTLQALTTQPDEWAGGVAIVPVTDIKAVYYLSDAHYRHYNEHFFGGPPEQEPDLYRDRSPITHVENLSKPVLMIAGKNDPSAPFPPVEAFYKTAKAMGKPVYLIAEDSGHGASTTDFLYKVFVNSMGFCASLKECE